MCAQSSEIRRQPGPLTKSAMDSRACHDTHRAAGLEDMAAPPALHVAETGPAALKATVRGTTAKVPRGAGAVVRAGSVVAPALLAVGPGITCRRNIVSKNIRRSDYLWIQSPQIDIRAHYRAHHRPAATHGAGRDTGNSARVLPFVQRITGPVRGDCSRQLPFGPKAGTWSGDRREVSLSPVPAPHPKPGLRFPGPIDNHIPGNRASRNCARRMAQNAP